ncbi:MAG: N-methyl-L-tryptophan oxidase, partial [Chloroflexota bacterium]
MFDLIVIGAGAIGSATAYHAAKAGRSVLLLEQYAIDHQRGSSHGYSRIIRYAYDHPAYVELAKAAYRAWSAFEEDSGETLYVRTGGLDFAMPGEPSFVTTVNTLAQTGIAHEVVSATEVREIFPQFRPPEDMIALYQKDAGILRASRSVQAHVRLARQYGAEVCDNMPVLSITPVGDGVEVKTPNETFSAAKIVIASGAWLKPMLLPLGLNLPLQPVAPQENYLNPRDAEAFTTDHFPIWMSHVQAEYGNILYGLPSIDGSGVKIGLHDGPPIDPAIAERTPDAALAQKMLDFARTFLPQAAGSVASSRVCLYTKTPDEHFIIDHHPQYPQVIIASCCSGHAFKFSTLLGSILTDFAFEGNSVHDIGLFKLSRFNKIEA